MVNQRSFQQLMKQEENCNANGHVHEKYTVGRVTYRTLEFQFQEILEVRRHGANDKGRYRDSLVLYFHEGKDNRGMRKSERQVYGRYINIPTALKLRNSIRNLPATSYIWLKLTKDTK